MLLVNLLNTWLVQSNEYKLLRIYNGRILAILSSCYLRYDNLELLNLVNKMVTNHNYLSIVSSELKNGILHVKIIDRRHKKELAENDLLYTGAVISNSELGLSSIKIEMMIYRAKEKAAFIFKEQSKHIYHTNKQIAEYCLGSDITDYDSINIDDESLNESITQNIMDILENSNMATKAIAMMKCLEALNTPISHKYPRLIDELAEKYTLTQTEKAQIYMKFINCADQNYLNLICTLGYKLTATDYLRATELERTAGNMLMSFRQLKDDAV